MTEIRAMSHKSLSLMRPQQLSVLVGLLLVLLWWSVSSWYNAGALKSPLKLRRTTCVALTRAQRKARQLEIAEFQNTREYTAKIREMKDRNYSEQNQVIENFLEQNVLKPDMRILNLGSGAGATIHLVHQHYRQRKWGLKGLVGVEPIPGLANFANERFERVNYISIYQGELTDLSMLPMSTTYDLVIINDVLDTISPKRMGCLYQELNHFTHAGSVVYMHTSSPHAQLQETSKQIIPHHDLINGMALYAGMELVTLEHDMDTQCVHARMPDAPKLIQKVHCSHGDWARYLHAVFHKPSDKLVLGGRALTDW